MKKYLSIIMTALACMLLISACTINLGSSPDMSQGTSSSNDNTQPENQNSKAANTSNFTMKIDTDDEQVGNMYYYLQFPEIESIFDDKYDRNNDSLEREAYSLAKEVINENGGKNGTITSTCEIISYTDANITAKETFTYTPQGESAITSEKTLSVNI